MNKQEWLNWRKIGSSDAPVIMGVAPRGWEVNTPRKLWSYMLEGKQRTETAAMRMGKDREEGTLQWFEKELGISFDRQVMIQSNEHNFMTATLDGLDKKKGVFIEIKNCNEEDFEYVLKNKVTPKYYPQVQHDLKILKELYGIDRGIFGCQNKDKHAFVEVSYDEGYIESLVNKEDKFWECYLEMIEPEAHEFDYEERTDETWTSTAKLWQEANQQLKSIEKKEEELRDELIKLAADRNAMGANVKLTKSLTRGSVDYSKIPELKDVNTEVYRKKSFIKWRLTAI